jgi:hypothetical protein
MVWTYILGEIFGVGRVENDVVQGQGRCVSDGSIEIGGLKVLQLRVVERDEGSACPILLGT